jgi:hypothetical protein
MQDQDYYKRTEISHSAIKDFEWMSPADWKKVFLDKEGEKESKLHFNKGSYLDALLLNPKNIDKDFFIGDFNSPISESVQNIVGAIYKIVKEKFPDEACIIDFLDVSDLIVNEIILAQAAEANYGNGNYKPERVIKEIREKGKEYYDFLCLADGKTILSKKDQLFALDKKNAMHSTEYTNPFFFQQPNDNLYHHLQIFTKDGRKGELDILRVCNKEKIIYIPDIKTAHSSFSFIENSRKYSYPGQLSFYRDLVLELLKGDVETNQEVHVKEEWKNYKIICQNIVIDEKTLVPLIYRYNDNDLNYYKFGSDYFSMAKPYLKYKRGWLNTWKVIQKHMELNMWNLPLEHYLKGCIEVYII